MPTNNITGYFLSNPSIAGGRLTLISGIPVISSDALAATTIYYTPYTSNRITLRVGSFWQEHTFSELSLSLSGLAANTNFDIFAYSNSGSVAIESLAWSNSGAGTSARATALTWLDGVRVKSGDSTRKYLGSFRTTGTIGQTEFTFQNPSSSRCKLFVLNEFNKHPFDVIKGGVPSHTYTTATWRSINGDAQWGIELIADDLNLYTFQLSGELDGGGIAIGLNSTTTKFRQELNNTGGTNDIMLSCNYNLKLSGYNYIQMIELGSGSYAFYSGYGDPELSMICLG